MSGHWKEERERWKAERERYKLLRREFRDSVRERLREERRNRNYLPNTGSASVHLIIGLLVAVLGILFLLSNLHIFDMHSPMKYFWSAVFLSIGFALVIEHRDERTWQWGIGWILVGLWSFAYKTGWINFDIWDLFWPILLLGVGAYLIRRALTEDRSGPSTVGPNGEPGAARTADKTIRGVGILSGSELKPTTQAMERAELFALMGGVKLDLYDAQLVNDTATINVAACMGGIEILVPSEWTVVSNVLPLMGAYIDKRRPAAATTGTTTKKTLTVSGFVLMGGVEIKN